VSEEVKEALRRQYKMLSLVELKMRLDELLVKLLSNVSKIYKAFPSSILQIQPCFIFTGLRKVAVWGVLMYNLLT